MSDDPLAGYPAYMSPGDVAAVLGTTIAQLANWRYRSRGPAWTKVTEGQSGLVRYPREQLRAYLAARTTTPAGHP